MRNLGLVGLASVFVLGLSGLGCSSTEATMRNVSGTVPASDKVTSVIAVQAGAGSAAKTYTAPVDASGHFSLQLPIGQRFVVGFMQGSNAVGVLRWKSGQSGAYTTILAVGHAPSGSPSVKPADASEEVEDQDVALGDVDNAAGDTLYEPSQNPEEQVDSDDDGQDDFDDADDDGDGEDDADESDAEDEVDSDSDGLPDQIDSDDNNDGTPDSGA